jgi:hypothetical protein
MARGTEPRPGGTNVRWNQLSGLGASRNCDLTWAVPWALMGRIPRRALHARGSFVWIGRSLPLRLPPHRVLRQARGRAGAAAAAAESPSQRIVPATAEELVALPHPLLIPLSEVPWSRDPFRVGTDW